MHSTAAPIETTVSVVNDRGQLRLRSVATDSVEEPGRATIRKQSASAGLSV
jgi:hypothetical protein